MTIHSTAITTTTTTTLCQRQPRSISMLIVWSRHLRKPAGRRNAGLFVNGTQQRWQRLHDISNRCSRIHFSCRRGGWTRVPGGDLGLHALDGTCIGLCEFLVRAGFKHLELQKALWAPECVDHFPVGLDCLSDTLGFTFLSIV